MFAPRVLQARLPSCTTCRLRASIAAKQFARSRRCIFKQQSRFLADIPNGSRTSPAIHHIVQEQNPENNALRARQIFGDALPDGYLNEEQYRIYERLYGTPLKYEEQTEIVRDELEEEELEEVEAGTGVLREASDGVLEEVQFDNEELEEEVLDEDEYLDDGDRQFTDKSIKEPDDIRLRADIQASLSQDDHLREAEPDSEDSPQRTHPLTLSTRFTTSPATLPLPEHSLADPISSLISPISNTHLQQAAHRIFGGIGLPYSTSTPNLAKTMQQKPIPLDASQSHMSDIEGDVFFSTLVPGMYASTMSVLVETRKRLGSAWAEELVKKAETNELRILDAGGGGAGILAVREMIKAEWERMYEDDPVLGSTTALAEADGRVGGASASPPLGHATVLTGSDVLRRRASALLENTAFIPRLPDYAHTTEAKKGGKFDLIIAPHTLWGLREDYLRRSHVQNLWSLLKQDGGVLLVIEKGVPRGFEVVAAARETLLDEYILNPPSSKTTDGQDDINHIHDILESNKEKGMLIAPCTNHNSCPMYAPRGMLKGRRDICHFSQRYVRPPFLQRILSAKDKNFEDVKFSYLSVMRGKDLRQPDADGQAKPGLAVEQSESSTLRAFQGYADTYPDLALPSESFREKSREHEHKHLLPLALSLPRAVLPPLKRKGHVILDLCTPGGSLERWTVPRSFGRQAFRDARKSSWGDLWALGAKTRVRQGPREVKRRGEVVDVEVGVVRSKGEGVKGRKGAKGRAVRGKRAVVG